MSSPRKKYRLPSLQWSIGTNCCRISCNVYSGTTTISLWGFLNSFFSFGQHFACLLLSFICKKKEEAIRRRWWTLSVSTCRPPCLVLFSCCDLLSRKRTHTDIRAWASRATKQVLGSFLLFPPPSFSFLPSLLFLMAARLIHGAD